MNGAPSPASSRPTTFVDGDVRFRTLSPRLDMRSRRGPDKGRHIDFDVDRPRVVDGVVYRYPGSVAYADGI